MPDVSAQGKRVSSLQGLSGPGCLLWRILLPVYPGHLVSLGEGSIVSVLVGRRVLLLAVYYLQGFSPIWSAFPFLHLGVGSGTHLWSRWVMSILGDPLLLCWKLGNTRVKSLLGWEWKGCWCPCPPLPHHVIPLVLGFPNQFTFSFHLSEFSFGCVLHYCQDCTYRGGEERASDLLLESEVSRLTCFIIGNYFLLW